MDSARDNSELEFVIETPLRTTVVVDTALKCEEAIQQIYSDCSEYKAVGFDCEWIGMRILHKYGNVLIVSICTPKDETSTKACVGTKFCVHHLLNDYQINVKGHVDLRTIAMESKDELEQRLGARLQHIAQHLYNFYVHRDLTDFDYTKFVAVEFSDESIAFAIKDVHAFIETYKHFVPGTNDKKP